MIRKPRGHFSTSQLLLGDKEQVFINEEPKPVEKAPVALQRVQKVNPFADPKQKKSKYQKR